VESFVRHENERLTLQTDPWVWVEGVIKEFWSYGGMAISGSGGLRGLEVWRHGDKWFGRAESFGGLELW